MVFQPFSISFIIWAFSNAVLKKKIFRSCQKTKRSSYRLFQTNGEGWRFNKMSVQKSKKRNRTRQLADTGNEAAWLESLYKPATTSLSGRGWGRRSPHSSTRHCATKNRAKIIEQATKRKCPRDILILIRHKSPFLFSSGEKTGNEGFCV